MYCRTSEEMWSHDTLMEGISVSSNLLYGYEVEMALGPNIDKKQFWQHADAKKKPWLCNSLMPSSAEQIKLSKATTQPPHLPWQQATWLTEGSEHCIAQFKITDRYESSHAPQGGPRELSYSVWDYQCLHSLRFVNAASAKMVRVMHVANL